MSSLWWTDRKALATALGRLGVGARAHPAAVRLDTLPGLGLPPTSRTAPGLATGLQPAAPPPRPFVPPAGELDERLDAYVDWLGEEVGGRRAFVADRDGLPLAGEASEHELMAIGSAVTRLCERINGRSAHRLGAGVLLEVAGERLQLVLVEGDFGVATVGLVVAAALTPPALRRLEEGLRAALAGPDQGGSSNSPER